MIIFGDGIADAAGLVAVVRDIVQLRGEMDVAAVVEAVINTGDGADLSAQVRGAGTGDAVGTGGAVGRGAKYFIVAVTDGHQRLALFDAAVAAGLEPASAIHPRAIVARDVTVEPGCIIAAGAVVNPAATLGRAVVIGIGATVDHHCSLAAGVTIGAGCHLAGAVTVGAGSTLQAGVNVRDHVTIGSDVAVHVGSVVVCDLADGVTAAGIPARPTV